MAAKLPKNSVIFYFQVKNYVINEGRNEIFNSRNKIDVRK